MIGDKNNNYTESESSTFPSSEKYSFNPLKSGCIDSSGNALGDKINYSSGIATIETDVSSYCYLYFDYVSLTDCNGAIGECLMDNPTLGLNTNLEGGLYRYQGETGSVNNFVCFGTTSKEECLSDTDKYMYRVMGVNESNQVKLIKKEALNTAYAWHSDYTTDIQWPYSDLYKGLNGISGSIYSNLFIGNTAYVPSGWNSKIAITNWKFGKNSIRDVTASELYLIENSWSNTISAKIGLIYMHDYYYGMAEGNNCSSSGAYNICKTSWLFLWSMENDVNSPNSSFEWTMSRYGYDVGNELYSAWVLYSLGYVRYYDVSSTLVAVRPTFFLTSDVLYKSGTGTIENPIILDTNPLVVNKVEASSVTSSSITLNITTSDNDLVDTYYYKCGDATNYLESDSNTPTCSGLTAGTSYNISVYVKDKFGHTSEVKTVSLKTQDIAGNYVLNTLKPSGLNQTMEGGLYRFQGTNSTVNNYICFGTSDKSTCTGNTDAYMYRIIGINEDGQLKLIKKEALNSTMYWWSDFSTYKPWPDSTLKANINGSYFLSNTTYVPSGWSDKIATTSWKYGNYIDVNQTAASLYSIENGWSATISAKIGLMYMHDYYYAYQSGGTNCYGSSGICKSSWIHLSQNDTGAPNAYEWTMSYYAEWSGYYGGWFIVYSDGSVNALIDLTHAGRPTFFLTTEVQYLSGSGSLSDPIMIF